VTLPAFAAKRRAAVAQFLLSAPGAGMADAVNSCWVPAPAIGRYLLPAERSAANPPAAVAVVDQ